MSHGLRGEKLGFFFLEKEMLQCKMTTANKTVYSLEPSLAKLMLINALSAGPIWEVYIMVENVFLTAKVASTPTNWAGGTFTSDVPLIISRGE